MSGSNETSTESMAALLEELRRRFADSADPRTVRVYLAARGYDARRIDAVLAAFSAMNREDDDAPLVDAAITTAPSTTPIRVQGAHERARFAPDAWGHLLHRRAMADWSIAELEHVIERALMHIDGRIALDDLRALLDGADAGPGGSTTVH